MNSDSFELIQQWQYIGPVHPNLLEDSVFEKLDEYGITSLESYVTWRDIEYRKDSPSFKFYDPLVDQIRKYHKKWVPFLILGPYYSMPDWFLESQESHFFRCMEHGIDSKIQSIWNPHLPKYVERFLRLFAEHYTDHTIFESINIGISGNWGESLYPDSGCFFGGFHTHPGWWYADSYALVSFQNFCRRKYSDIESLNHQWNSQYSNFEAIELPQTDHTPPSTKQRLFTTLLPHYRKLPEQFRKSVKRMIYDRQIDTYWKRFNEIKPVDAEEMYRQCISEWYLFSMESWMEVWLRLIREYFPNTPIYVKNGGSGKPYSGADFSAQVKIARKYDAGIRITNQTDDYEESFVITRLTASASKFYGIYYTTEEAGVNQSDGMAMRCFDAITTHARGMYHKGLVGAGKCVCTQTDFPIGEYTQGADILKKHLSLFGFAQKTPDISIGIYYPQQTFLTRDKLLAPFQRIASIFRRYYDFDFFDDRLIVEGSLESVRFLIFVVGDIISEETLDALYRWIEKGNILFVPQHYRFRLVGKNGLDTEVKLGDNTFESKGKGYIVAVPSSRKNYVSSIVSMIANHSGSYPWKGEQTIDMSGKKIYTSYYGNQKIEYNKHEKTMIVKETE